MPARIITAVEKTITGWRLRASPMPQARMATISLSAL